MNSARPVKINATNVIYIFVLLFHHLFLQQCNAADLNSKSSLNCYGKGFKCVNQTHFQLCSRSGEEYGVLTTIDSVIESCIAGQMCDDSSPTHCGTIGSKDSEYKHQPIRLIKGNRASNWRPKLSLQTDKQKQNAAEFRNRLIKRRQEQEIFIDSVLANLKLNSLFTRRQFQTYKGTNILCY